MKKHSRSVATSASLTALFAGLTLLGTACSGAAQPTELGDDSVDDTAAALCARTLSLSVLSTYKTGDVGAAEISAYCPDTQRIFTVNASGKRVDVLDVSNPAAPALVGSLSVAATPNSVAIKHGLLAIAAEAPLRTDPGSVSFFDASTLQLLREVPVGAVPDMVTFTPDGTKVLTANEGEPSADYGTDPEGSVSIIDVTTAGDFAVRTARFTGDVPLENAASVRLFGPNATLAQDLEPEYIAVSADSKTAWVTLQENNAIAKLDLRTGQFATIKGLGFKDHSLAGNGLDVSDRDGANTIKSWPVYGMYQPDAIASFRVRGQTYLLTANEGDARDYSGFKEEARVADLVAAGRIDPASPVVALAAKPQLGRLTVTTATGDDDGDGDLDRVLAFGARSFSVWSADADQVFDSGDEIEQRLASLHPDDFNKDQTVTAVRDDRSDNKGPEPEAATVGVIRGRPYGFVGLERIGGVLVYDLTEPKRPRFVTYFNPRNFSAATPADAKDLGPEGLLFIPGGSSPSGRPLLVVSNEISGTVTLLDIDVR